MMICYNKDMDYVAVEKFLNNYNGLIENYKNELDKKNKNEDNLFSSISNSFKNENYTSDILRFILDPKSMGNRIYLQEFLKFIGIGSKCNDRFLSDLKSIEVLREKHRVDILIRNIKEKKAIILESKLNDANDQPMQLIRYYKILTEEENYEVLKIVYLTINPKNPRLDYYEDYDITKRKYEEIKEKVTSLLFKVFIGSGNSTEEFHNFQDYLELPEVAKSDVIQQFSRLINKIGGRITMTEIEIIEKIFSNLDTKENVSALADLWNTHAKVLCQIFYQDFPKKLDMKYWKKDSDGCLYSKEEITSGIKLYICPISDNKQNFWTQIGFYAVKASAFKGIKTTITQILENTFSEMNFKIDGEYNGIHDDNRWYCLEYTYDEKEPLDIYFENLKKMIEIFKKNAQEYLFHNNEC